MTMTRRLLCAWMWGALVTGAAFTATWYGWYGGNLKGIWSVLFMVTLFAGLIIIPGVVFLMFVRLLGRRFLPRIFYNETGGLAALCAAGLCTGAAIGYASVYSSGIAGSHLTAVALLAGAIGGGVAGVIIGSGNKAISANTHGIRNMQQ